MKHEGNGGFPLLRKFYMRTRVNFYARNYDRGNILGVNVKVKRGRTFTFARDLPYIASILFTRVQFTCLRT